MVRSKGAWAAIVLVGMLAGGCSSDDGSSATTAATTVTTPMTDATTVPATTVPTIDATEPTAAATTASTAPSTAPPTTSTGRPIDVGALDLVETLAADDLQGRDNGTSESGLAQQVLVDRLSRFADPWQPLDATGGGYLQGFTSGTNVIAIVPGTDLADEYVMIGAHYDHLGRGDCALVTPADDICNGAVDNAAGTAAAMAVAEAVAAEAPRRSLVIAFWDAEEDGLLGSRAFVAAPVVPLDRIVTYVNFDMQGSDLLPSLAEHTIAVGAETGGAALVDLLAQVTDASDLRYARLSLIMGQGRSDHAPLADAGVPVVFFTDATNGCYHSVEDEISIVDTGKLAAQVATATELVRRLAGDDVSIAFDGDAPVTSFADAEQLLDLARAGEVDLVGVDAATANAARGIIDALDGVVASGPAAYDGTAAGTVLGAAARLVDLLTTLDCALAAPAG